MIFDVRLPFMDNLKVEDTIPIIMREEDYAFYKKREGSFGTISLRRMSGNHKRLAGGFIKEVKRIRFRALDLRVLRFSTGPKWSRERARKYYAKTIPYLTEETIVVLMWLEVNSVE